MTKIFSDTFLSRRTALLSGLALAVSPRLVGATTAREITWDDLIPPGLAYPEIIGMGELDEVADTWNPVYDETGFMLNEELNGAMIKMPGFIIPIEQSSDGVSSFVLVPYVGACIHTPPPPPNQLVFVDAHATPWKDDTLWDPVWVTGLMKTQIQTTEVAETGYAIDARDIEIYVW